MAAGGLDAASDLELGQAFRDGDDAALAALYDRHLRAVYDFVARVVRDPAAAEDLTQMTFVRAWEGRDKLRDPARVKAWLFTIAHNLALNHVTRGRKLESIDDQFDLDRCVHRQQRNADGAARVLACVTEDLADVLRLFLGTRDAHGLYEQFGFVAGVRLDRWMERVVGGERTGSEGASPS